jgi:NAD(P)-dependent dehydrogenase (short-subunit alcohol dehydrogenase family)
MNLQSRVVLLTGAKRVGAGGAAGEPRRRRGDRHHRSKTEADEVARAAGRRRRAPGGAMSRSTRMRLDYRPGRPRVRPPDVLINMASLYQSVPFDSIDAGVWDRHLAVDLRGSFLCAKAAVPIMRRHGGGRIINFSDWVAASARPRYKGYLAYYVAKSGVKALTEGLALELATDNILVNAIAPGPILAPPG